MNSPKKYRPSNASEGGASLRGAGMRIVAETKGGQWNCRSRPRMIADNDQRKLRWERTA